MARKKVKFAMITNKRLRKSTEKRRVTNLFKKAHELSILCNIEMFIIIFNRNEGETTMWPSQDMVMNGVSKFLAIPEQERVKKMVLQEKHLTDKMEELSEKISKLRLKNDDTEMKILMKQFNDGKSFNDEEMDRMNHLIDESLKRLKKRSDELDAMPTRVSTDEAGPSHSTRDAMPTRVSTDEAGPSHSTRDAMPTRVSTDEAGPSHSTREI
ncbi:hypothetical protein CASFOL_005859 [Castilleja foliolosa]|uniref:MADS-box domain-containing protein n=1 Tax=Castilleja foliolosa TaxID=1961234 RepID=A0ABD3E5P5_9LAMI